jgi:hypothetical protein
MKNFSGFVEYNYKCTGESYDRRMEFSQNKYAASEEDKT